MHATIYGRGQMVIPAKARKEARIDTATSSTFSRRATVAWCWSEWNGQSENRGTRFGSFAGKENTRCFPSVGRFRARKSSKRLSNFRHDLSP